MSNSSNSQNFMDPKTLIAVVLVGLGWVGWQSYMQTKYPEFYQKETVETNSTVGERQTTAENKVATSGDGPNHGTSNESFKNDEISETKPRPEVLSGFSDEVWSFSISSKGMGVRDLKLKQYLDREHKPKHLGHDEGTLPFETNIIGRRVPLDFDVKRVNANEFIGVAKVGNLSVVKRVQVNSELYSLESTVSVRGASEMFAGLTTYLSENLKESNSVSFFLPTFERQEFFISFDGESERIILNDDDEVKGSFSKVNLASLGSQYFTMAIYDKSDVMPEFKPLVNRAQKAIFGKMSYNVLNKGSDFTINYTAFAGPKSLNLLSQVNESMASIIDYGIFSFLAKYILSLLKVFHSMLGNWGVAIILLTILVRAVLLPFNLMSFKSMKNMQTVQPKIKALREQYKDDREKLNQEMMVLMRENKVNPLGGCLPMLLQLPVFFALYQVLGQSIELYQAPFMLWIQDLSLKDPYYVLPILMGVTMFVQQKLTPNTMDPAQAKVLMFMPLLFSLFMISLPSGLTLYIFISALFAIIQQLYFLKERKQPQTA